MLRRLFLTALLLALAACQTVRLDSDFDPHRDYASLQSWAWKEPAVQYSPDDPRLSSDLTAQRVRDAVAQQLEQRGLRQVADAAADFHVQAFMIVDNRQDQVATAYVGGGYWGRGYWGGMWGYPYTEVRTYDYQVGTLQLDFIDRDGRLIWRGSAEQVLRRGQRSPAERSSEIHDTVAKILAQYPPRGR